MHRCNPKVLPRISPLFIPRNTKLSIHTFANVYQLPEDVYILLVVNAVLHGILNQQRIVIGYHGIEIMEGYVICLHLFRPMVLLSAMYD